MAKKMTVLDKEISLLKVCDEALIMANLPQLKAVKRERLADVFPDQNILHTVCAKLNWSQLKLLLSIDDELKRSFVTVYPYGGAGGEAPEKKNIFSRLRREKKKISKGFALWIP